jgi:hypothetical protein
VPALAESWSVSPNAAHVDHQAEARCCLPQTDSSLLIKRCRVATLNRILDEKTASTPGGASLRVIKDNPHARMPLRSCSHSLRQLICGRCSRSLRHRAGAPYCLPASLIRVGTTILAAEPVGRTFKFEKNGFADSRISMVRNDRYWMKRASQARQSRVPQIVPEQAVQVQSGSCPARSMRSNFIDPDDLPYCNPIPRSP